MELHREEKREDRDRGDQGGEEGDSKRERAIYPVIKSLCALHSLEHPERFTELHGEEKRRGKEEIEVARRRRVGGSKGERQI